MPGWRRQSKFQLPESSIGCFGVLVSLFGAFVVWGLMFGDRDPNTPLAVMAAGLIFALFLTFGGAAIVMRFLQERAARRRKE